MTTLEEIDAALAKIPATPVTDADFDERSRLMAQRCELEQAEKAAAAAANSKPKPRGNLIVTIPAKLGISHFSSNTGRVVQARSEGGRTVLDLFAPEFAALRMGPQGLLWEQANSDLMLSGQISSTIAA
jgi:hypothetical protein